MSDINKDPTLPESGGFQYHPLFGCESAMYTIYEKFSHQVTHPPRTLPGIESVNECLPIGFGDYLDMEAAANEGMMRQFEIVLRAPGFPTPDYLSPIPHLALPQVQTHQEMAYSVTVDLLERAVMSVMGYRLQKTGFEARNSLRPLELGQTGYQVFAEGSQEGSKVHTISADSSATSEAEYAGLLAFMENGFYKVVTPRHN